MSEEIDIEAELTKVLQEALAEEWDKTPLGYNKTNNAYHIGKGMMISKESWGKYLKKKKTNPDLNPLDYILGGLKDVYNDMKIGKI